MPAAYDTYNYPTYWKGRDYEHESEIMAIKDLLQGVEKINTILDIGAGYGRLMPSYSFRAKNIIIADPSSKLLKIARKNNKDANNVKYLHTKVENINNKLRANSVDMVIMVRVLHHIEDCDYAFGKINKLIKSKGYFLLEFANKMHFKATFSQLSKGNFTFPIDIFPKDIRSEKHKKDKTLPFVNYHPDDVFKKLEDNGFEVIDKRSVSNIRSTKIKNMLPLDLLTTLEKHVQKPFAKFNLGPSIFVLCRKK